MRQIDANELMEWLRGKIRECVFLNAHAEAAITEEIMRYVKHMPAIPAIQIEWLEAQNNSTEYFKTVQGQAVELIHELWQKEQEAR